MPTSYPSPTGGPTGRSRVLAARRRLRSVMTGVEIIAFVIGVAGTIAGVVLVFYERDDRLGSERPYIGAGVSTIVSSLVLASLMLLATGYATWRLVETETAELEA